MLLALQVVLPKGFRAHTSSKGACRFEANTSLTSPDARTKYCRMMQAVALGASFANMLAAVEPLHVDTVQSKQKMLSIDESQLLCHLLFRTCDI